MIKKYKNLINLKKKTLFNRDKIVNEVSYRVNSGSLVVLESEKGFGKTTILRALISKFRGKGKVCYLDLEQHKEGLNLLNFVKEKKRNMILLLDNVEHLTFRDSEKIKYYFDQDYVKSAVFATNNFEDVSFSAALKTRIGNNLVKVENLDLENSFKVLEEFLPGGSEIDDTALEEIFKNSESLYDFLKTVDDSFETLNIKEEDVIEISEEDEK